MTARPQKRTVGIGSMVVDRLHRVPRILGADEKGILRGSAAGVREVRVGGVVLNHLGWAAALGLPTGIFGKQADDDGGRFLRTAMDRLGIEREIVLDGSASSSADLYVDDAGGRAIYMAPGATSETTAEHVRTHHAATIRGALRVTTEVSQLPLAAVREVLAIAVAAGVPTLLDLDVPPRDAVPGLGDAATLEAVLRAARILKPAKEAARALVPEAGGDALAIAEALREALRQRRGGGDGRRRRLRDRGRGRRAARAGVPQSSACSTRRAPATRSSAACSSRSRRASAGADAGRLGNACGAACVEKLGAFPDDPAWARERVLARYDGAKLPAWVGKSAAGAVSAAGADALAAYDVAVEELIALRKRLDPAAFERAVALIRAAEAAGGRVHVTGIGKPEHVARLRREPAVVHRHARHLPARHRGRARQRRPGGARRRRDRDQQQRRHRAGGERGRGARARRAGDRGDGQRALAARGARRPGARRAASSARAAGSASRRARASRRSCWCWPRSRPRSRRARGFTRAEYHARHPGGALGKKSSQSAGGGSRCRTSPCGAARCA